MTPEELQDAIARASYVVRSLLAEIEPSWERTVAEMKLNELEFWVGRKLGRSVRYESVKGNEVR